MVSIKGMALHVAKQVVGSLECTSDSIRTKLGSSSREVMEVVLIQGDVITVGDEHHGPVMVAVAARRCRGRAIELIVGERDARARIMGHDELATDEGEFAVVNPDTVITALEIEAIAAPDETRVDGRKGNTLNDDITGTLLEREPFAFEDTLSITADDALIAPNFESSRASGIVGDGADGDVVASAAREVSEVQLAPLGSAAALAITAGPGGLGAGEVKFLVDDNGAGGRVGEPCCEFGGGGWCCGGGFAGAGDAGCEAVCGADDGLG